MGETIETKGKDNSIKWPPETEKQIARIGRELARSTAGTDLKTSSNHLFHFQRLSTDKSKTYGSGSATEGGSNLHKSITYFDSPSLAFLRSISS